MKRARLESRRVRVVLSTPRQPLPTGIKSLLAEAAKLGKEQAKRFVGAAEVRHEKFEEEFTKLHAQDKNHLGLRHLCRALFFAGLHIEIERISRQQPIASQQTIQNIFVTGALTSRELATAQLHVTPTNNARLFFLSLPGIVDEWWTRQCAGSIAVARLIYFLIDEKWRVFFPTSTEDIHWKIDLIATIPGESSSICFQVKSNQHINWLLHRVHLRPPNGRDSEATHRFFEGVRRFQAHTHGFYVPVELSLGSRQYADGEVVTKGHLLDALRHMISEASCDDSLAHT